MPSADAPPGERKREPSGHGSRIDTEIANAGDIFHNTADVEPQHGGPRHISIVLVDLLASVCRQYDVAAVDGGRS